LGLAIDLAISAGVAFGESIYVSDPASQRILRVNMNGAVSPFATGMAFTQNGFDADLLLSDGGLTMYVANSTQIVKITAAPDQGACCHDGTCRPLTATACQATGGVFQGAGSACGAETCPPCDGDVNLDGAVNVVDLVSVIQDWGPCLVDLCAFDACLSDVNGDGAVNVVDLVQVIQDWGPCD
jgi:hypothetical protein